MRIGPFELRPRRLPMLMTLVLVPALVGLGVWQLQRAEEKRVLQAQWQRQRDMAPRPLAEVLRGQAPRFAPVVAQGRFDTGHQFLLDNQIRSHRPGYQVLTPLRLQGSERAILVNRGWIPMGDGRRDLPRIPTPEGSVRVTGYLVDPPQAGLRLGPADPGKGRWPKVVQYLAPQRASRQLGYPVVARAVRLAEGAPHGFPRDWNAPLPVGPARHTGYALQWFGLGVAVLVIFLAVNLRRDDRKGERDVAAG